MLPPPACIHGVAGLPASWCWEGCADGGPTGPEGLPVAVAPFEVTVPEGSRITSASAFLPGAPDAHHYLDVEGGTTLSGLPPTADMISVTVFWAEGGDATYYWGVKSASIPPASPAATGGITRDQAVGLARVALRQAGVDWEVMEAEAGPLGQVRPGRDQHEWGRGLAADLEVWRVVVTAGDLSGEVVIDATDGAVYSSIMGIAN